MFSERGVPSPRDPFFPRASEVVFSVSNLPRASLFFPRRWIFSPSFMSVLLRVCFSHGFPPMKPGRHSFDPPPPCTKEPRCGGSVIVGPPHHPRTVPRALSCPQADFTLSTRHPPVDKRQFFPPKNMSCPRRACKHLAFSLQGFLPSPASISRSLSPPALCHPTTNDSSVAGRNTHAPLFPNRPLSPFHCFTEIGSPLSVP